MPSDIEWPEHSPLPRGSLLDAAYRLNVSTLINRAHLAIQNNDLDSAQRFVRDAGAITYKLQDPKVPKSRCWFWLGVIADHNGDHETAPVCFASALRCRYHSREGEHLLFYIKKYKHQIVEALIEAFKDSRLETEEKQLCRELVKELLEDEDAKRNEQTLDAEGLPESPSSVQSRRGSSDREDDGEALHQLIGDSGHPQPHISQHEVQEGVVSSPKAAPGSTAPHSLPQNGLMKALPMGNRPDQDRGTALLERSGTIRDRPRPLFLPKDNTKDETRLQSTSLARDIEEFSNGEFVEGLHSSSLSKGFSKRLLTPLETQSHEQSSDPETPSPLRKASIPGDDMTFEEDLEA